MHDSIEGAYRGWGKRALDLAICLPLLVITAPIWSFIAMLVKISGAGPILYVQNRVGRGGVIFPVSKFRTMLPGADEVDQKAAHITAREDARVTSFGKLLRYFKIDEFPQILNIIKGDMSIVGPRPFIPELCEIYDDNFADDSALIFSVRPGLTDYCSILYRHEREMLKHIAGDDPIEFYNKVIIPEKVALRRKYAEDIRLVKDLAIVLRTIMVLLMPSRLNSEPVPDWYCEARRSASTTRQ